MLYLFIFAVSASADNLPKGFVDLEKSIPGIVIELRYITEDNFLGRAVDGYERPRSILTKQASQALKGVQEELKTFGLGLKVFDTYRPQRAVDDFVRWAKDINDTKMKVLYYPEVEKKDLFEQGYIAARSGHSRGSTVDLTIVSYEKGLFKELDMGTRWDFFGPKSWAKDLSVTPQQRANRMLLQKLMQKYGFKASLLHRLNTQNFDEVISFIIKADFCTPRALDRFARAPTDWLIQRNLTQSMGESTAPSGKS